MSARVRPVAALALAALVHWGLVRLCDRVEVVERMLSPYGVAAIPAALVAVALFALRLAVLFVLPGYVLARVLRSR